MTHGRSSQLGYEPIAEEALERERLDQVRRPAGGDQFRKRLADYRRRLEAVGPPPRADQEAVDVGQAEDRRVVGADVAQPGPATQHARPLELRQQLERMPA